MVMSDALVEAINSLREDIRLHHKENAKRLDASETRQEKLENTLADLASNMSKLAVSMARFEEVQERMEKDNERQREVDEQQNKKLDLLNEKFHETDKKLSSLEGIPQEVREMKYRVKDNENRTDGLNEAHSGLYATLKEVQKSVEGLERRQEANGVKLDSIGGWGKWFKEKILPSLIIAGVPSAITYIVMSQGK